MDDDEEIVEENEKEKEIVSPKGFFLQKYHRSSKFLQFNIKLSLSDSLELFFCVCVGGIVYS